MYTYHKLSFLFQLQQYRRTGLRLIFHIGIIHLNSNPHDEDRRSFFQILRATNKKIVIHEYIFKRIIMSYNLVQAKYRRCHKKKTINKFLKQKNVDGISIEYKNQNGYFGSKTILKMDNFEKKKKS